MMNVCRRLLVAVLFLLLNPFDGVAAPCSESGTRAFVFVINGIWVSPASAEADRLAFKDKLQTSLGCTLPVLSANNTSVGRAEDLYEAAVQAKLLPPGGDDVFWLTVHGLQAVAEAKYGALAGLVGRFIWNEIQEAALAFNGQPTTQMESDIRIHLSLYEPAFVDGRRVVLVGHSQGNFFANIEYQRIVQDVPERASRLSLVAIATPADEIAGDLTNLHYTNLRGDFIRVLSDLSWNVPVADSTLILHNPNCGLDVPSDVDCHFFQTYLSEEVTWNKILVDIRSVLAVNYDGFWSGSTTQGKSFSFQVSNQRITQFSLGFSLLTGLCRLEGSFAYGTSSVDPGIAINGNTFSRSLFLGGGVTTISLMGTFDSAFSASGTATISTSSTHPSCGAGSATTTWTVSKP